uniref:Uncharacterized protein n=1 Tax=Arundo donax TaxID=35708 RepID=A0A0A9GMX9_ARUDO
MLPTNHYRCIDVGYKISKKKGQQDKPKTSRH